ncbi:unnamed protein product, partial [Phaeothamnion confervicola]
ILCRSGGVARDRHHAHIRSESVCAVVIPFVSSFSKRFAFPCPPFCFGASRKDRTFWHARGHTQKKYDAVQRSCGSPTRAAPPPSPLYCAGFAADFSAAAAGAAAVFATATATAAARRAAA